MFRRNQSAESFPSEANVLNSPGEELIDYARSVLATDRMLGDLASPDGLARSLLYGRGSTQIDGVDQFQPGVDPVSNIDYSATYASSIPQARKVLSHGSPSKLHVVMDAPERTRELEGKYSYESIGNFVVALTARIGEAIGDAELHVYHTFAKSRDGSIYEGDPEDAYEVFRRLRTTRSEHEKSLDELLTTVAGNIDNDNDASIVISDFMDGYDGQVDEFEWEQSLLRLGRAQEDLLWINQIRSASHDRLPYGVVQGLDFSTVRSMNKAYEPQAQAKKDRIERLFGRMQAKVVRIDTADTSPASTIIKGLVGNSVE